MDRHGEAEATGPPTAASEAIETVIRWPTTWRPTRPGFSSRCAPAPASIGSPEKTTDTLWSPGTGAGKLTRWWWRRAPTSAPASRPSPPTSTRASSSWMPAATGTGPSWPTAASSGHAQRPGSVDRAGRRRGARGVVVEAASLAARGYRVALPGDRPAGAVPTGRRRAVVDGKHSGRLPRREPISTEDQVGSMPRSATALVTVPPIVADTWPSQGRNGWTAGGVLSEDGITRR